MHRKMLKNKTEKKIQELWGNFKISKILVIGVAAEENTKRKQYLK